MHPMLQHTIMSGIAAGVVALLLPIIPRKVRKPILVGFILLICYFTLFRGSSGTRQIMLEPFWSYRKWSAADVRWQIYMNIFLFVPLGGGLKSLGVKHAVLIALGVSVLVEALQYLFALGFCETDDVINNTLGALLGSGLYMLSNKFIWRRSDV